MLYRIITTIDGRFQPQRTSNRPDKCPTTQQDYINIDYPQKSIGLAKYVIDRKKKELMKTYFEPVTVWEG